jgi:hypothetical protein
MVRGGPAHASGNERESLTSCQPRSSPRAKKVCVSLVSIQKNITKLLRRSARVQLRGGLGAVDTENGGRTTHCHSSRRCVRSCHVHSASTIRLDDRESRDAQGKLEAGHMIYLTPPIPRADQLLSMRGSKIQELRFIPLEYWFLKP